MIAIVDYQMGNLRSVQKAIERIGAIATVTDDPAVLADAEKIILPGVGAFEDAMAELDRRHLVAPILAFAESGPIRRSGVQARTIGGGIVGCSIAYHLARRGATVEFPCRAQVVAATNPCPCGFEGDRRDALRGSSHA